MRRSVKGQMTNDTGVSLVRDGERLDDLQLGRAGDHPGSEQILLRSGCGVPVGFCQGKAGETVLDMGTGNGIIPILLSAKTQGRKFTGA